MQTLIPISPDGGPLFSQIYRGLRRAILAADYRAGDRLPATRDLAEQLGVSRTVVVLAYEHLLAEGFVVGRAGSGTYVAPSLSAARTSGGEKPARLLLSRFGRFAAAAGPRVGFPTPPPTALRFDFAYGRSDAEGFPFEQWRRILHRRARRMPGQDIEYGPAAGSTALREAICAHLRRSRAVACEPSQVIVVSGSQQALDLAVQVLIDPGDRVALENPCYQGTREICRARGASLHALTVDRDGVDPASLPNDVRMAFVTPSHQFPTGAILPLARRQALLDWARRSNAVIVEDDYDGEFRHDGKPLESLQGLDTQGRVVYIGTFSRTIFPALRLGYLVVPKSLRRSFTTAKWLCNRHTATLEQETLAEFISNGSYERHLRRMRRRLAARRRVLLDAVHEHMGERVAIGGDGAGAHIVLWPAGNIPEERIVTAAAACEVGVYGTARYYLGRAPRPGIILGYSRLRAADIREGVRRLAGIL